MTTVIFDPVYLEIDGSARSQGGPMGAGWVIRSHEHEKLDSGWAFTGHGTNNMAEYHALLVGLQATLERGYRRVLVRSDSMLLVMQMAGKWRIKESTLLALNTEATWLVGCFEMVSFMHIPREANTDADALSRAWRKEIA